MRNRTIVQTLAIAACVGMFMVLLMGVTVTQTESGRGCGDDWPLCNGEWVPAYTIESMIEYSHRLISAAVGLVILASTIAVFARVKRKDARWFAAGALFFTVLQAGLGAAQVKNPQSDAILALHFGFSLLALTCTLLTVTSVRAAIRSERGESDKPAKPVSPGFRWTVWLTTLYCYAVVYTGAYTSHTESGTGCVGFPLCNGELVPATLSGATGIAFTHRTAAYLLFAVVLAVALFARRAYADRRDVAGGATWSLLLVTAQVASGAALMALIGSENYVFGTLLHIAIISALFAVLSGLSIAVWRAGRRSAD